MFLQLSVILSTGWCVVARGHVWLLGGMCGCRGACVAARGLAWLLGGHAWLLGGLCSCWGVGMCGWGGVHGCQGACIGYDKIRSMSGRYASYWNAFLFVLWFPGPRRIRVTLEKKELLFFVNCHHCKNYDGSNDQSPHRSVETIWEHKRLAKHYFNYIYRMVGVQKSVKIQYWKFATISVAAAWTTLVLFEGVICFLDWWRRFQFLDLFCTLSLMALSVHQEAFHILKEVG